MAATMSWPIYGRVKRKERGVSAGRQSARKHKNTYKHRAPLYAINPALSGVCCRYDLLLLALHTEQELPSVFTSKQGWKALVQAEFNQRIQQMARV